MFCLRYLPLVSLLASCSVYTDSLLDQARPSGAAGSHSDAGGNLNLAQAGRQTGGGSRTVDAEQTGGDDSGTPNATGGTSGVASGGKPSVGGASAGGATVGGTPSGGSAGTGGVVNPPTGVDMLDDMEDGNFYLSPKPPRFGYWYVAGDTTVGAKLPKIEALVSALSPARESSTSAVHFEASGFKGWGASVGLSFADASQKRAAYDAGTALGISFWIRGSVADNTKLKVQLPILGTDPSGKQCGATDQGQCLDHFATQITVTSEWKEVTILFSALHQAGWGVPLGAFDPAQMLGIEWSAGVANLDVWIDDLALLRP